MRSTRPALFALVGLSLLAGACRSDDDPNPTVDAPPNGDMNTPPVTSIRDVQNDALPSGAPVQLSNVVITAIDTYGARVGDLYVQEQSGAPEFSGIKVFGVTTEQLLGLAVGDVVTINGAEKDEFALDTDLSGRTVTELKPVSGGMMTVMKTGTAALPTPAMVDAKAIDELATQAEKDTAWEKWEGVLITVINARQTTAVEDFASGMTQPADDQYQFSISGGARVQTALAAFPTPEPAVQTCYAGITGIGDYFFNYLLQPRMTSDLTAGGTGCAVSQTATIAGIQAGTTLGPVTLNDVYISGIAFNKKNFWISSSLTAAPNEGLYVFRGSGAAVLPMDVVVGAKVNVTGVAAEFQGTDNMGESVTQLTGPAVTVVTAPTTAPTAVTGQTVADLKVAATGEPYESVLVTLTNVKVTALGAMPNFIVELTQTVGGIATAFKGDDDVFRFVATPTDPTGTCYASITGFWTYQVFEDEYMFIPTAAGTGTGVCN